MQKLGIVILNYLNYKDTIECKQYFKYGVSGGRNCDCGQPFRKRFVQNSENEYRKYDNIIVVKANKNYGFAKGNNIGIRIVRQTFHADFVFVVNNDTVFVNKDYFEKLLSCYSPGIGVIGSAICLNENQIQQEIRFDISLKANLYMWVIYYLKRRKKMSGDFWFPLLKRQYNQYFKWMRTSFDPGFFFQFYTGFYDKTFLYEEEPILYLM